MLHAFSHKKSRLYRRYLGHRDDATERRVAEEDEITSIVMGPLAFLSPAAIGAFWVGLVHLRNPEHEFPDGLPTQAQMHFWPRRGGIEPDLRVDLAWGCETRTLLVEFKWRAPLSGERQLHEQWGTYMKEEQGRGLHLFIGLETSAASNAQAREDIWDGKLLMRSWFDVLTTLPTLKTAAGLELKRWGEQVGAFLNLLAVRPFCGFKNLPVVDIDRVPSSIFFSSEPDQSTVRSSVQ